jgi:hypothetical protein
MSRARYRGLFVLAVGMLAAVTIAMGADGLTEAQCSALYSANKAAIDNSWPSPAAFIAACKTGGLKNVPASDVQTMPQGKASPPQR